MTSVTRLPLDEIDFSNPEFWTRPDEEREAAFATLRAEQPISFQKEPELEFQPAGPGYWALTRYDDVWTASRHPDVFLSGKGTNIPDMPVEIAEFFGSMITMDDPRHAKLRSIVNRGFTPKMVSSLADNVHIKAREIVDRVAPLGKCDFVQEIAAALPLQIICDMMGIPPSHYTRIFELTNVILGVGDPEYVNSIEDLMAAAMELYQFAMELGEARLENPADDITSKLMHADVEGEALTTQEFGSFFILLVVAGNETTRNAISHGMKALTDHPDQRKIWLDDFDAVTPTAVEEIVRWATPVIHFRRTASRDTELSGQKISEGEKVVLWYNSANRDESHFDDPYAFDVRRTPNDHVGFGAGGPHFCLGAHLARREIAVMFEELLRRLPDIEVTGPPDMLQSAFIHGIKRMPCAFTPA
jgi:methyl-branched lipid omega-hydroxylase